MSGLKLCRTKLGKRAYYISGIMINIYSLEELCYYIYNNVYTLDDDFISDEFIDYIATELEEKPLSDMLRALRNDKAPLSQYIMAIISYIDYYTADEIKAFENEIKELLTQPVEIRIKLKGDNFLNSRRYNSAIKTYSELLSNASRYEPVFVGNINHNMAVAYAKLFLFKDASKLFKKAYELTHNPESLKMYYIANKLANEKDPENADEDSYYTAMHQLEVVLNDANAEEDFKNIDYTFKLIEKGNYSEYQSSINKMLSNWIDEYKEVTK